MSPCPPRMGKDRFRLSFCSQSLEALCILLMSTRARPACQQASLAHHAAVLQAWSTMKTDLNNRSVKKDLCLDYSTLPCAPHMILVAVSPL